MKTKTQAALLLTPEDEKQIARGTRGVQFQHWRKEAGLTLTEVSNALKKEGFRVSVSALSLFERGGADRKGNLVTGARRVNVDFGPEVFSRLEELYGVPKAQREHSRGFFPLLGVQESTKEQIINQRQPALMAELGRLRAENAVLRMQLEQAEKLNATVERTLKFLQSTFDAAHPLGRGKK